MGSDGTLSGDREFRELYGSFTPDGIMRQRSQCRIYVDSHVNPDGKYDHDLSRDVVSCETSKTLKGGGGATFLLVPRVNYTNLLFPNDYVNIYFNPGDGRGWIRTFFGFIDRIARTINIDPDGNSVTRYVVTCSDFTKAFDSIQIYFNPQLNQRNDIIKDFSANLGGVMLRTKGLTMHGSPADILMSLLHVTVGFGAQFVLPPSLQGKVSDLIKQNRATRLAWMRQGLPDTVQQVLDASVSKTVSGVKQAIQAEATQLAQERTGSLYRQPTQREIEAAMPDVLRRWGVSSNIPGTLKFLAGTRAKALAEAEEVAALPQAFLIDLIDFRHIEWEAIDGKIVSASITQSEGTLWSLMNAWSNGEINELFCDLRPLQDPPSTAGGLSGGKQTKYIHEGPYSFQPDELEGNVDTGDEGEGEHGVTYAPCIVMREHPFSTVQDFNPPPEVMVNSQYVGPVTFGAIFSEQPGTPGRKVIEVPVMNEALIDRTGGQGKAYRHLDVAVISVRDIIQENIGRGDHNHVNLIEVYCDITSGMIRFSQQMLKNVVPIVSGINIARHGLRVRKVVTKFGRWGGMGSKLGGGVMNLQTNRVLLRWALLLDHWYQHSLEYLNGTMTTRAFPEIRVGYRLDVRERHESYYVEGVANRWQYPNPMTTTITLTRGQRNDPYPVYVHPSSGGFLGLRGEGGRLGEFFLVENPSAVTASSVAGIKNPRSAFMPDSADENSVDIASESTSKWAQAEAYGLFGKGYSTAGASGVAAQAKIKAEADQAAFAKAHPEIEVLEYMVSKGDAIGGIKIP